MHEISDNFIKTLPFTSRFGSTPAGVCILLKHCFRLHRKLVLDRRMKWGLALMVLNIPIGYGGLLLSFLLCSLSKKTSWLALGVFSYVFSWLMFMGGAFLLAADCLPRVRQALKSKYRAWQRLRRMALCQVNG